VNNNNRRKDISVNTMNDCSIGTGTIIHCIHRAVEEEQEEEISSMK
jgi:hypothetical protein